MRNPHRVPMRRGLRVLLFASLALNLLVAGLAAGMILSGPSERRGAQRSDVMAPYVRALDREGRRATFGTLRERMRAQGVSDRSARRDEHAEASRLLRADPVDNAAFEALLNAQGARGAARQQTGRTVLAEYLTGLSAAERRAYADRLDAELERRRDIGREERRAEDPSGDRTD